MENDPKERYQRELGEKFGTVFHGLFQHWAGGWVRLNETRELFSEPDQVKLLNAVTGGGFLWDVQRLFLDDLMLCVARLTDHQENGGQENLTVRWLPEFCSDPDLRTEVERLVNVAVGSAEHARNYRNQQITHIGLNLEQDEQAKPLLRASLDEVQASLDAVHAALNAISKHLLDAELANFVSVSGRARRFRSNSEMLAKIIQFIDSSIDPTGTTKFTDMRVSDDFLDKLGQPQDWENTNLIIRLRELARKLKKDREEQLQISTISL